MGSCQKPHALMSVLFIALSLAGCGSKPVPPPNEYRIALQELDSAWLTECLGLGDIPDRRVGTLLQDFTDLVSVAAPCRADHNALVQYLKPLVEKAKSGK